MANILFAWERGARSGHLLRHRALMAALARRGHRLLFAVRELAVAERVLKPLGVPFVQAPPPGPRLPPEARDLPLKNLAHMYHNIGFHDVAGTRVRVAAWRDLFRTFQADLLIADFSPTALLAARGFGLPRAAAGSGFMFPPDAAPMPAIQFWDPAEEALLRRGEERLVAAVNAAIRPLGIPLLESAAPLVHGDLNLIHTFPELDPYHPRSSPTLYRGAPTGNPDGVAPVWPVGDKNQRIFAYLIASPDLPAIVEALQRTGRPTLIYSPEASVTLQEQLSGGSLRFSPVPFAMPRVVEESALTVLNGNHGSLLNALSAGRPLLLFPRHIEHLALARRAAGEGMGLVWDMEAMARGETIDLLLARLLRESAFGERAAAVAERVAQRPPPPTPDETADELEMLISAPIKN